MMKHICRMMCVVIASLAVTACSDSEVTPPDRNLKIDLAIGEEVGAITFIHNQKHRGLNGFALALGEAGAAIYNMNGDEIWREETPARLVTYDGSALLIYRTHEDKTILDRYSASDLKRITFVERQKPSEIAATTLQRTSFSSLGSLTISEDMVKLLSGDFTTYLTYRSAHPVAAVASTSKPMPYFPDGVVAIASSDGHIELLSEADFKAQLK